MRYRLGLLLFAGAFWTPCPALAGDGNIVESHLEITPAGLAVADMTGEALALVPDLGGVGFPALAVGRPGDDTGPLDAGAVDLLFLAPDGSVTSRLEISETAIGDPFGAFLLLAGQRCPPLVASMSRALTRTWSPARRTLPSNT